MENEDISDFSQRHFLRRHLSDSRFDTENSSLIFFPVKTFDMS